MALSNRDRVGRAFELLAKGLEPYVDRRMTRAAGESWFGDFLYRAKGLSDDATLDDPAVSLRALTECWDAGFRSELTRGDRNVAFELRQVRNDWAHNKPFTHDDAYRALDSIERLLTAIDAVESDAVGAMKEELMRLKYEAQAKRAAAKLDLAVGDETAGLTPWREVVTPHEDVARGRFSLAEFAADLHQVRLGEGADEYRDPVEFFRRTYLTVGLRELLSQALRRVVGDGGGTPVVDLQTNFGGGKTHSMIALHHLFSGRQPHEFPQEVQDLLREAGVTSLPEVRRAVLVGTKLTPGQPDRKPDGTEVRTLWGELAWQLGGRQAFEAIAESDARGTSPGDELRRLFERHAPCLVLIDEWVAYARQLYDASDLPAGTFDTHFTFAQALTEAARGASGVLLVVSIPASEALDNGGGTGVTDVEIGGAAGHEALRRLRSVIGRMEWAWRPASAEEAFEIVRRRLFQPIDTGLLPHRDATARAFGEFYRRQASEFPTECREPGYVDRIKRAYPIHPELFARLYEDWSTLDRFQRTRGVLRLMANVIHGLWASGDRSPLIMPASIPLDLTEVTSELTRNLEDQWKPIIDKDVDGPDSLPAQIDNTYANLGRYSAARRAARTVFLATAPHHTSNRGVEIARVKLGCALPGETVATFGDALTRLSDRATYLYVDGARYWYGTQPGVGRMAQERAERYLNQARDDVHAQIIQRLQPARTQRAEFTGVHVAPRATGDVPDEPETRLVILPPHRPHLRSGDTPALTAAQEYLSMRGNAPRQYRNTLAFLAADQRRLEELERAVAAYLAWREIDEQADDLNLDTQQRTQAGRKRAEADAAVTLRVAETYHWLLVPAQSDHTGPVQWDTVKAEGQGGLAERASRRLVHEDRLKIAYPPVLLRQVLDHVLAPLWEDGHVSVKDLWDAFARYPYLPRLRDVDVLLQTVKQGPASTNWEAEGFATASGIDDGGYLDLTMGSLPPVVTSATLLVKPSLAVAQREREMAHQAAHAEQPGGVGSIARAGEKPGEEDEPGDGPTISRAPTRFYGRISLDPERHARDFGKIQQEVLSQLSAELGTALEITVEIRATNDEAFNDTTVRNVSENARTLNFEHHEFE